MLPKFSDLKFNSFGMIEIGRSKGRTILAKHFRPLDNLDPSGPKGMPIIIEAEICDVWGSFDGIGQEFTITIKKVRKG